MASYTYDQAMQALRNAHAAGDTQAAQRFAQIAHGLKGASAAPAPTLDQSKEDKRKATYRAAASHLSDEEFEAQYQKMQGTQDAIMDVGTGVADALTYGTGSRALGLASGAAGAVDQVVRAASRATGGSGEQSMLGAAADSLRAKSEEMRPTDSQTSWEEVKKNPTIQNILRFGAEQGITSLPDMAASLARLPAYAGARFGELLEERLQNQNKEVPDAEDFAWAAGAAGLSAAGERFGAEAVFGPGKSVAGRIVKGIIGESATEAGQEAVEDIGTTANTPVGLDAARTLDRMAAGAVGGGVAGAGFRTIGEFTSPVAEETKTKQKNPDITDDHRRAAERLIRAVDGDQSRFLVMDENNQKSARSAAKAALQELRSEKNILVADMKKLARKMDDAADAETALAVVDDILQDATDVDKKETAFGALDVLHRTTRDSTAAVPQSYIDRVRKYFGHTADADRLASLANQIGMIEQFVRPGGTRGGISKYTRPFDITDTNNHITRALLASGGLMHGLRTIAGGFAINRAAIALDKLTNRRSTVKRFVDAANDGQTPESIQGISSKDFLKKTQEAADKAKARAKLRQGAARFGPWSNIKAPGGKDIKPSYTPKPSRATQKLAEEARKKADQRATLELQRQNLKGMFETNTVPENPYYEPYQLWEKYTGLGPRETLETLQKMAQQPGSQVTEEDVLRFGSDIHAFDTVRAINLQEAVRQAVNPKHVPPKGSQHEEALKVALKGKRYTPKAKSSSRRDVKSAEGTRRYFKLLDKLDNDPNLDEKQRVELMALADKINSPEFTREDRQEIVNETLPQIFGDSKMGRIKEALWKLSFHGLVSIGNDYRIERDEDAEGDTPTEDQAEANRTFKERAKASRKAKDKAPATPVAQKKEAPPEPSQSLPEVPSKEVDYVEEQAEAKDPKPVVPSEPKQSDSPVEKKLREKAQSGYEKKEKKKRSGGHGNRPGLAEQLGMAFDSFDVAKAIKQDYEDALIAHQDFLMRQATPAAQVELMMLASSGRNTQNQLTELYADLAEVSLDIAVKVVDHALGQMEAAGKIVRSLPTGNTAIKQDGSFVKTTDGKAVVTVNVDPVEGTQFSEMMEIAKAVDKLGKLPQTEAAHLPYSKYSLRQGPFRAFKDIPDSQVTDAHAPLLDFVNSLRVSPVKVDTRIMEMIENAVLNADEKRLGEIATQLKKKTADGDTDASNLLAAAQLIFQIKENGRSPLLHQEWMAGRNGRVYAKNGSATTQGGSLMKGLFRSPVRVAPGDAAGVDFMFHAFGNILGFDKDAPVKRRGAIFEKDTLELLLKFAEDPFKRDVFTTRRSGERNRLGQLVDGSESFFETLAVALELKDIVDFAKARHPQFKNPKQMLLDPAVREDIAKNYTTDYFVQLDANNNSFQLVGLMTGDQAMLEATGLQPPAGDTTPADQRQPADVYVVPAVEVAKRIPELGGLLSLSDGVKRLRKLFKRPISTYVYASTSKSRNKSFMDELSNMAEGAGFVSGSGKDRKVHIFGFEGGQEGFITIPKSVHEPMSRGEPATFQKDKYDNDGDVVKTTLVQRRLIEKDGKWMIETTEGTKAPTIGKMQFDTKEDAISEAFERDFKSRLNRELVREIEQRFPKVREFMNFTGTVEKIMRGRGLKTIKVPTPDGMPLEYRFKDSDIFAPFEVNLGDKVVKRLGLRTEDSTTKGRGLAAFLAHSHDAYVMREVYRRGGPWIAFNPIHDSFGFHPSEAARGQQLVLEVMQEMGNHSYNIFENVMKANGITLEEFQKARGGELIQRQGITPVPASEIPTAVS